MHIPAFHNLQSIQVNIQSYYQTMQMHGAWIKKQKCAGDPAHVKTFQSGERVS